MLQRAASNAYSWWWASHIRTKQSKWLDQCLQDMEEKVQSILKLIEEDGDSFAKRAEMYYKRRPELISNVEEAYKSFRALADRYDHLSKELQNANHTIATVIPDQVQFAIDEDDDCSNPKIGKTITSTGQTTPQKNVPKVPTPPTQDIKALISTASRQLKDKKALKSQSSSKKVNSGLNRDEAVKEIDRLQKEILALQTMKEFVKSSYESGVAKYWELENQIMEMQQQACSLRDEFDVDMMIEDDDARTLMAQAALKSCQETLAILEAAQEKSTREAREEYQRIEAAWERLKSVTRKYLHEKRDEDDDDYDAKTAASGDYGDVIHDAVEEIQKSPIESINWSAMGSLTASELAEKVEQLVNKVINLESAVSSQTVLVHTLRTETDDLNEQIRDLEDGHEALVDDVHGVGTKVKEVEERLNKIQGLNKNLERESSTLQTTFAEARSGIDCLSGKLSSIKPDEDESEETSNSTHEVETPEEKQDDHKDREMGPSGLEHEESENIKEMEVNASSLERSASEKMEAERGIKRSATFLERKLKELVNDDSHKSTGTYEEREFRIKVEEIDWNQILLSGMEDREKILLKEYTVMLRNYREVKKKLGDMEKKEKDSQFDVTLQMRELKKAILKRDEEIQTLRQRIGLVQGDNDIGEDSSPLCKREVELNENQDVDTPISDEEDDMRSVFIDKTEPISIVEEKFRYKIDAVLDENLDFWLRFSSAFHQVQKFRTEVEDLQDEIAKIKEKKKHDGIITIQIRSEIRPIYKHLREIQAELGLWLEQSASLKDELKRRFASLCSIQEEMTTALKEGVEEDEIKFSTHQAAKFQGEILNMKQENSKVREELRAGLDHVSMLQIEIEKTLRNLSEDFGISNDQPDNMTRGRVPLRSFLFGTKPKRKHSIFSHMQPNRRYQILRAGIHLSKFHS